MARRVAAAEPDEGLAARIAARDRTVSTVPASDEPPPLLTRSAPVATLKTGTTAQARQRRRLTSVVPGVTSAGAGIPI